MKKPKSNKKSRQPFSMELMWKQRYLLAMSVPFLIWLFIPSFCLGAFSILG